ncbi:putative ubiquitin-conjugating enzyme protein [Erysiphe neolycopersici]|uniref:Putative ubiquitin-conjugating enzyme protein n=1 Tax=Erysiphe neolycopersici TaxID=212602 RepID=A0A420I0E9_9PEZI|nr:putative ubiquitin-conjugating enzyme protein [Erysiphe neolycopersici]
MASLPRKSTCLELYRSDITRSEPIKITKTSQTVSNCSTSEKTSCEGYGLSKLFAEGKWSPSIIYDWPVKVQKKRSKIQSCRSSSYESMTKDSMSLNEVMMAQRAKLSLREGRHYDIPLMLSVEDLNATPKSKKQISRGDLSSSVLKSKSHREKNQTETTRLPAQNNREILPRKGPLNYHRYFDSRVSKCSDSKERYSESKENVFPTQEVDEKSGCQRTFSINSNIHTAYKALFIKKHHLHNKKWILSPSESSSYSLRSNSIKTRDSYSSNDTNFRESYHSRRTLSSIKRLFTRSLSSTITTTISQSTNNFILFPEIIITPEAPSIDYTESSFWVAVEIIGTLRQVEKEKNKSIEIHQETSCRKKDKKDYGYLESMHIYLKAGQGCVITEIIDNNFGPITIGVNESHLVLVKITIGAVATPIYTHASLDNLLEEFKNDHRKIESEYITVRVNYIHSESNGIEFCTIFTPDFSPQKTQIQTENSASICRYGPKLACLPYQSHQMIDILQSKNPVLDIINTRMPSLEAREASRLIASSRECVMPLKCSTLMDKPNKFIGSIGSIESNINLDAFPRPPSDNLELNKSPRSSCYFDPYREIQAQLNYGSPLIETRNLSKINFSRTSDENDLRLSSESMLASSFDDSIQESTGQQTSDETMELTVKSKNSVAAIPSPRAPSLDNNLSLTEGSKFGSQFSLGIESNWLLGLFSGS